MVTQKGKADRFRALHAGVKRISLATSLYRAAMTSLLEAALEVRDKGQFSLLEHCVTTAQLNKAMHA